MTNQTTISVKENTRKRLQQVCNDIRAGSYDTGINILLDKLKYPSWEEMEKAAAERIEQMDASMEVA